MHRSIISSAAFAVHLVWAGMACAAQLRVEPILLELNAPSAAASLTLRNDEDADVFVQTRVFRWTQSEGRESLEPTTDVVASPPAVKLPPHADYVVGVVRVAKQPVLGEESYRVIIDQLPRIGSNQTRSVNFLIRQSIPVFFRGREFSKPSVSWSVGFQDGKLIAAVANGGDERLRIASLRLQDSAGTTVSFGNGLIGYVLGRSSMRWVGPKYPPGFGSSGPITVTAATDKGQTRAVIESPAHR